ncbi:MAG: hypothetical protein VE98_C0001G0358 [candidate division Kazan bacterium GW2011_GWA1_50_15]|uniref:Uncharacterized protein n=2 Tax=Bacteria division Kazan-3B-28 TaxID=1798534 RepID=A0A0G4BB65_UNCK3|nr:MAG: hypothetical protein VE98_C0001G0358 [candidate division Kazan bacterium GW2011_GWA1_50_15]KKW25369.1 MAG: hypothetical protein VE99_C0001G0006 [candidate division Kazan bacterium GW2011_GWC1_52_13]HCR42869.1 hypothetical protein [Patescibacteria group bacterium]
MTVVLTVVMVFGGFQFAPLRFNVLPAQATQITINGDLFNLTGQYGPSPSVVWVSDTTGYAFYIDDTTDTPAYKKTTNSGASWGGEVELGTDQDWMDIAVWYDQWTPGDTSGTYIYMVAHETAGTNDDDVYFKRLDTASDTLSPTGTTWTKIGDNTVDMVYASGGSPSIIKSTDNKLYALWFWGDATASYKVYSAADVGGSSWSDTGFSMAGGIDHGQIFPLSGGDVMIVVHDTSATDLVSMVYDASAPTWDGSWTTIDSSFAYHTTYDVAWGGALNKNTGDIYVVGNNDPATSGGDIETYWYDESGRSWSTNTNVYTDIGTAGLGGAVAIDQQNGDLYAFYLRGTVASSMSVYYKKSTTGGSTWGSEQGPVSSSAGNYIYVRAGSVTPYKIFATWYDSANADMLGVNFTDTSALDIAEVRMMLFWDGTLITMPAGWSSVSNDATDIFYQKFPRGNSAYGPWGGADTHTPTATPGTITDNLSLSISQSGTTVAGDQHTHSWSATASSKSLLPSYRELQVVQYDSGMPSTLPQNIIAMFDATVPTGWTRYSAQDNTFVRGGPDGETTGGSNTAHDHDITLTGGTVTSGGAVGGTTGPPFTGAAAAHNHTGSGTSTTGNHVPIHVEVIMGKKDSTGAIPANLVAMFTADPGSAWTVSSGSSQTFNRRYLEAQSSYTADGSGGASSHSHTVSDITTGGASSSAGFDMPAPPPGVTIAVDDHTHSAPVTIADTDNLPTYVDTVIAKSKPYKPGSKNWRWFDAEDVADPNTTNGGETTTGDALSDEDNDSTSTPPSSTRIVYPGNAIKLRVVVGEANGVGATDVKYKLQFDTSTSFTGATDVEAQGGNTVAWRYYNGANVTDDDAIVNVRLTNNSPTAGRHNEDSGTGAGSGSTFDPAASTNYEHEFTIQRNPGVIVAPGTTYYFRLQYMENSAAAGGSWATVSKDSNNSYPALTTSAATDLEMATAPADVYLGAYTKGGGGTLSYPFEAGEEFVFWDKRGNQTSYTVSVGSMSMPKSGGGDTIPGTDITWKSTTTVLNGSFASSKTDMTGQTGATLDADRNAYTGPGSTYINGKGGFYFLPTIDLADLESRTVGDYSGTLTITII